MFLGGYGSLGVVDSVVVTLKTLVENDRPEIYREASAGIFLATGKSLEFETKPSLVFDLASLTKGLFTAPRIFQFAAERGILLERPISESASLELKSRLSPALLSLTYDQILSHTSGLPAWMNTYTECLGVDTGSSLAKLGFHLNRVAQRPLGPKTFCYSDIGFLLLGFILQVETKMSLGKQLRAWTDLSGSRLSYAPLDRPEVASTGYCPMRQRELKGEVHDENCFYLGGETGHAGLFGSLLDVKLHLNWLFKESFGLSFLHRNALVRKLPHQNSHLTHDGLLGLRQGSGLSAYDFCSGLAIGHLGFTGTAFWIEPESKDFVIHMTNRVANGRLSKGITQSRQNFCEFANSERAKC